MPDRAVAERPNFETLGYTAAACAALPGSLHAGAVQRSAEALGKGANGARSIMRTGVGMPERRPLRSKQSSGRITLRDVAREAGVSIATASRVLNNSPSVSPETREDVLRVFAELEFAPDPLARALNAGGTNTVGAVIPTINHAIFAAFLEALEARLDANGYRLLIATTGMDRRVELERARSLLEMGARALIVTGLDHEPELTSLAKRFGAPVVATSIYEASASMPTIGYDNVELGRQAMRHLLDLGHTDVALVSGPTVQNDRARLRIRGAESVEGVRSLRTIETELSVGGGVAAAQQALAWDRRPTALLCVTDLFALGSCVRASAERHPPAPGHVGHRIRSHLMVRAQPSTPDLHKPARRRDGRGKRAGDLRLPHGRHANPLGPVAG